MPLPPVDLLIYHDLQYSDLYVFFIHSSHYKTWRMTMEVCYRIYRPEDNSERKRCMLHNNHLNAVYM